MDMVTVMDMVTGMGMSMVAVVEGGGCGDGCGVRLVAWRVAWRGAWANGRVGAGEGSGVARCGADSSRRCA
eukprot:3448365-Prymnesium_polylepis.1